jgi:hypothetical protein
MPLIWVCDQSRWLRHNGTTGKLRMARMRDLPVGRISAEKQMRKIVAERLSPQLRSQRKGHGREGKV